MIFYTLISPLFRFSFFGGTGFKLRILYLQSRYSTTWTTPPVHFAFNYFWIWSCIFCLDWPGLQCYFLVFLHSWDDTYIPPCPTLGWDGGGGLMIFLPRLASHCYPSYLCLPSNCDYRREQPHLASTAFVFVLRQGSLILMILLLSLPNDTVGHSTWPSSAC
jgi:hypothetical protein